MNINTDLTNQRIKELRKEKGLTQEELAGKLHVSRQIISYYETNRMPSVDDLVFLAKEFGTTTDYLLGLTGAKTTDKDVAFICNYTGLNEETVKGLSLRKLAFEEDLAGINAFLEYNAVEEPLHVIDKYIESLKSEAVSLNNFLKQIEKKFEKAKRPPKAWDDFERIARQLIEASDEKADSKRYKAIKLFEAFIDSRAGDLITIYDNAKAKAIEEKERIFHAAIKEHRAKESISLDEWRRIIHGDDS